MFLNIFTLRYSASSAGKVDKWVNAQESRLKETTSCCRWIPVTVDVSNFDLVFNHKYSPAANNNYWQNWQQVKLDIVLSDCFVSLWVVINKGIENKVKLSI